MCGVVGIVSASPVNQQLYDALLALQHRGQDSAGMVTWDDAYRLNLRKGNGLVRDVFEERHMHRLRGNMGVGHVRYPTAGTSSAAEAQPMYVNAPYGISLAHNGNLTNAERLEMDVFRAGLRHVNTTSDSEILLNVFAHELHKIGVFEPRPGARVRGDCRGQSSLSGRLRDRRHDQRSGNRRIPRPPRHPTLGVRGQTGG